MSGIQLLKRLSKPTLILLSLVPLGVLVHGFLTDTLSSDPLAEITRTTGTWTLRFLLLTLAVTPAQKLTGWNSLGQLRRILGLLAFFYGCMHLTTYLWLDQFFAWDEILKDVAKRPFITVGIGSFVLMVPLAATSWNRMIRWMGGKRWKRLHRLGYAIAAGGVVHYLWLVKADRQRPLVYGALLGVLLGYRVWASASKRFARRPRAHPPQVRHIG